MNKLLTIVLTLVTIFYSSETFAKKKSLKNQENQFQNDYPAYIIYNSEGEKIPYSQMIAGLMNHDVCLFGEFHDDPISHWLEKMVTKEVLKEKGANLILGGEMWETDQQLLMDELLSGLIDKKSYSQAAVNWPNFKDYKPLIGIALKNNLQFVCTNIPRRYANIIYKKGENYLDSLPEEAYRYLPPLPIHFDLEQPAYAKMLNVFASDEKNNRNSVGPMGNFKGENLVKAQAIKDATMAHNILKYWEKGKYFMHYNGVFHSKGQQGIYFYLKYYNPEVDVVTISVARQESVLELLPENNTANYNIIVQKNITKTY